MQYTKPFPKAEYDRRLVETKKRMVDQGFDLIICQDPANMNWLTGFDSWSFYTPQVVLVHTDEASPIWFGRPQDAKAAHITTDIPPENMTLLPGYNSMSGYKFRVYTGIWAETNILVGIENLVRIQFTSQYICSCNVTCQLWFAPCV